LQVLGICAGTSACAEAIEKVAVGAKLSNGHCREADAARQAGVRQALYVV